MMLELFCKNEQHLILRDCIAFSRVCVDLSTQWQTPLNLERELFCTRDTRELQWKFSQVGNPCNRFAGFFGRNSRTATSCTVYNGVRSLHIKILYLGYSAWRMPSCLQG